MFAVLCWWRCTTCSSVELEIHSEIVWLVIGRYDSLVKWYFILGERFLTRFCILWTDVHKCFLVMFFRLSRKGVNIKCAVLVFFCIFVGVGLFNHKLILCVWTYFANFIFFKLVTFSIEERCVQNVVCFKVLLMGFLECSFWGFSWFKWQDVPFFGFSFSLCSVRLVFVYNLCTVSTSRTCSVNFVLILFTCSPYWLRGFLYIVLRMVEWCMV